MMNQYVCRCCLKENPEITYKIFDTSSLLWQELQECSPPSVKYEHNDGLPQTICDICWLSVQQAKEFRRQCLLADQELRNRYAEYKNKAVEEVLGLVEKFRQQDNEILGSHHNHISEQIFENLDETQNLPDLDFLEMSFVTDSITYDKDFYNSSHDSGIFEEQFNSQKINNFENETSNDSSSDLQSSTISPQSRKSTQRKSSKGPFVCSQCDKKFTRNFQLKLHLISIHNMGDGLQYTCQMCSKTFASHHSLSYHQKSIHYQQKPHACSHCDRQFITKSQLISHMRIHTGETKPRIFECQECDKKWPTKSDLKTHMRTHDPNVKRPFKCNRCEKSFFTRGHLTSHLLVHTGEKPYLCEFCNRSYQSVGNLNNHMLRRHNKKIMTSEDNEETENKGEDCKRLKDDSDGGELVLMEL